ncbi:MAG: NAD(P)H-binding protein [Cyclobacteriaceae bacterium]|nr:NAD(P)H-binding protein [Cyclobacteriaceae bacterium]
MMTKIALIAGATGLIGNQLLEFLISDSHYSKIIALSRKPLSITNPKVENIVMEVEQLERHPELKADDVFCCLGTTMKQAGSKVAFRKVDFDYPLHLAKVLKGNGAQQFLLISALGANKNSLVFYNQVKGEIEEAIKSVGFKALHILRPSLLLGSRKEQRSGEDAAKVFYKIFGFLIPKKYQGLESIKVARAMHALSKKELAGVFIYESNVLQEY